MTLVVLAAGMGSRYGGMKQIDPITENGEFIIDFSVYDAIKAGFEQSDSYYSASAFVGSADAREIVGRLLRDCIIYDGEDVGAYIDEAFKNAVESCEMYR